jgi:hypothetical protein
MHPKAELKTQLYLGGDRGNLRNNMVNFKSIRLRGPILIFYLIEKTLVPTYHWSLYYCASSFEKDLKISFSKCKKHKYQKHHL